MDNSMDYFLPRDQVESWFEYSTRSVPTEGKKGWSADQMNACKGAIAGVPKAMTVLRKEQRERRV